MPKQIEPLFQQMVCCSFTVRLIVLGHGQSLQGPCIIPRQSSNKSIHRSGHPSSACEFQPFSLLLFPHLYLARLWRVLYPRICNIKGYIARSRLRKQAVWYVDSTLLVISISKARQHSSICSGIISQSSLPSRYNRHGERYKQNGYPRKDNRRLRSFRVPNYKTLNCSVLGAQQTSD